MGRGTVTDDNMRFAVKYAAAALKYHERGIPIDRMDTHSLRSGGACALKLSGYDSDAIRKMGRWAPGSSAFLEYIQQQLSEITVGISTRMSNIGTFTNMEGGVAREDLRPTTIF